MAPCIPPGPRRGRLPAAALALALALSLPAWAVAAPDGPPPAATAASTAPVAAAAQAEARPAEARPAEAAAVPVSTLRVFNREVFTFRAAAVGLTPYDRMRRAAHRIEERLTGHGPHQVALKANPLGTLVLIDESIVFFVTAQDADPVLAETEVAAAERAAAALREAIEATRESRQFDRVLRSVAVAAAATAVTFGLLWLAFRARQIVAAWLVRLGHTHVERLRFSGVPLIRRERLAWAAQGLVRALHLLVSVLLLYTWVGTVLTQFPYTRVWGANLKNYLIDLAEGIGGGMLGAVPGLATAAVIFFLTRMVSGVLDGFFERAASGETRLSWLDADVVAPTRRIAKVALWLFALAMAYPYLPGSHTEAFKGLSVLLGLMLSIGSSNLVGHAGAGLILTYARVFRRGEFVRIADHEGTVTDLGMFATRLRTGLGEEVTLSNSLVLGSVTRNYSRTVKGAGFVLDTVVTIGYDTPWRQVHALLEQAALRTPGVLAQPAPQVFQTSLSDFYPEYRLVCQAVPADPRPRAQVLSALLANIQDVFNEHGVQIMSPHYRSDPAQPKLVPPSQWYAAPARDDRDAPAAAAASPAMRADPPR